MAGWDGEIFLHATTCMSVVSYFFKTLSKSHKWTKWISSQHYPYVVSRENLTRINKIITNGKISKGILQNAERQCWMTPEVYRSIRVRKLSESSYRSVFPG